MKYPVWFVRFLFASWMIPAGLNHFVPLFPQPLGSQPLSMELILALLDSHLFDLVKAVELIAGIAVLFGFYTPLALLICMPVSFGVFYWDAPLEGWGSIAAIFGYSTLLCNVLMCLAYNKYYRPMFTLRAGVSERKLQVLAGRILLGAGMVLFAVYGLFMSPPAGSLPLADQLMTSLVNSRLLHVALVMQLFAGVLMLTGIMVPLALCVQMAITVNALFWALLLEHSILWGLLTLIAFALNGLLMLAFLPYYRQILQRHSTAVGEDSVSYDSLFVNFRGRTPQAQFIPALLTVLAAIFFFLYFVTGRTAEFCALVLIYPLFTLLTRRVRDMGFSPWLVLAPLVLMLLAFGIQLGYLSLGEGIDTAVRWIALVATAAVMVWGSVSTGKQAPPTIP